MGRKYNTPYKKGKFLSGSTKSIKADRARTSKHVTRDYNLWKSDTRKYDYHPIDTRPSITEGLFKYKYRSKKKLGKKVGRENKHYRRYWRKRK